MTSIKMITEAASRLAGQARVTPLLTSPFLDEIAGRHLMVKAECLQHTGSFKFRGAWSALSGMSAEQRRNGVLAYSSGNHGQGIAFAAQKHNVPAVVVMPSDAPDTKISKTKKLGAEVVLYDRETEDRDAIGARISGERGMPLIKPFDDPFVIAGQGTVGLEIATQAGLGDDDDAVDVLVCCGGGGLTSGVALALADRVPKARVRPCEPVGFDDVTRSLISGKIESNLLKSGSICDAIISNSPGDITFPILKKTCAPGLVVTEEECLRAMALAFSHLKIIVEPGGAASLAAALFHGGQISGKSVIAIATGGNVDAPLFTRAISAFGSGL